MSSRPMHFLRAGLVVAIAALVASCGGSGGGGGGDNNPPTSSNTPPASASADVNGFIAYLKVLTPTRQDFVEPLDVATFVAPQSDNTEPDLSI